MKIAVIGAGSWGSALAILLSEQGHELRMWEYVEAQAELYTKGERAIPFLPGIRLPEPIAVSHQMEEVLPGADLVVLAVPTHGLRDTLALMKPHLQESSVLVDVAKGLEQGSLKRMSEVVCDALAGWPLQHYICLSGPSHAEEVARRVPTTVVAAGVDLPIARKVQEAFANRYFRVYTNNDLTGVELGGALKNVIALASGMCDGLGFGDNTKGALLTRGMVEMARLGTHLGGRAETFWGLSGMGDLITTCMSKHSRNRYVGEELGRGRSLKGILASMNMVAEGVRTADSSNALREREGVDMPITEAVYRILYEGASPREQVFELMTRTLKGEH